MFKTKQLCIGLVILAGIMPSAYAAEDQPAATPYRPTVSNPADLSHPGWLELEFGGQRIKGGSSSGDRRRESTPVLVKLAFSENWGILIGGELQVRRIDTGDALYKGAGDTTFTLKHRIPTATEGSAWGIEAGYKFPTAKDAIGSAKADTILNGIFSTDFSGNHLDLNLGASRLGAITEQQGRIQTNWAASLSRNLDDKWGLFGELSGSYQRGAPALSQFLAGASYNYSKRLVFDVGATTGLAKASPTWSVFAGVTVLLGKLW